MTWVHEVKKNCVYSQNFDETNRMGLMSVPLFKQQDGKNYTGIMQLLKL